MGQGGHWFPQFLVLMEAKPPSLIDFRLLLAPHILYLHALVGIYKLYPRYTPWPKMDFCTKLFPGPGKEKFVLFVQLLSFLFMLMSLSSLKLHVGETKKLSNNVYSVVGKYFSCKDKGNSSSNNMKVLSIQNFERSVYY